jgi:uncharacterized protein (TIGR02646 family)
MRFIDPCDIEVRLPADWAKTVAAALKHVSDKVVECEAECEAKSLSPADTSKAVAKARAKAINERSSVWSEAGKVLRQISDEKCWYCETYESRSDMPVDHFRPKNSVAECNGKHCGYWWLAFDWHNYRFSCTFCNSRRIDVETEGGKQDHFPLLNPGERAMCESDPIEKEQPVLLDPCDIDDIYLISFTEMGLAWEAIQDENDNRYKRANESITLYHLNHTKIVRERKLLAIKIRSLVDRIVKALTTGGSNSASNDERRELLKELASLICKNKAYCTAARIFLKAHAHIPFVEHLITRTV